MKKRVIAVALAMSMLVTMPSEVYALSDIFLVEDYEETDEAISEFIEDSEVDLQTEAVQEELQATERLLFIIQLIMRCSIKKELVRLMPLLLECCY